jgi:hypothetical protein
MIHAVLAGLLISLALISLVVEKWQNTNIKISKGFSYFYGSGTFIWLVLGQQFGNYILMGISSVQLCCVLLLLFTNDKEIL